MEETIQELSEAELDQVHGGQGADAACLMSTDGNCVC
jgi:hypothetical protein